MADQIKAIFLTALDIPTDRRPAYLDQACSGDTEVRRRVEALLRAHDEPDRLLDHPAWGQAPEQDCLPTLPEAGPPPATGPTEESCHVLLAEDVAVAEAGLFAVDPGVIRRHVVQGGRPAKWANSPTGE
jgi:hypothetical protein